MKTGLLINPGDKNETINKTPPSFLPNFWVILKCQWDLEAAEWKYGSTGNDRER